MKVKLSLSSVGKKMLLPLASVAFIMSGLLYFLSNEEVPHVPIPTLEGTAIQNDIPLNASVIERNGHKIYYEKSPFTIARDRLDETTEHIMVNIGPEFGLSGRAHPLDLILGRSYFHRCSRNSKKAQEVWFYVYKKDLSENETGFAPERFGISPCAPWKGDFPQYPSLIEDMIEVEEGDLIYVAMKDTEFDAFDGRGELPRIELTEFVEPVVTLCSDDIDNDGDGATDFPDDADCLDANQNYERTMADFEIVYPPNGSVLRSYRYMDGQREYVYVTYSVVSKQEKHPDFLTMVIDGDQDRMIQHHEIDGTIPIRIGEGEHTLDVTMHYRDGTTDTISTSFTLQLEQVGGHYVFFEPRMYSGQSTFASFGPVIRTDAQNGLYDVSLTYFLNTARAFFQNGNPRESIYERAEGEALIGTHTQCIDNVDNDGDSLTDDDDNDCTLELLSRSSSDEQYALLKTRPPGEMPKIGRDTMNVELPLGTHDLKLRFRDSGSSDENYEASVTVIASACSDGIDNNRNGLTDMNDPGCASESDGSEEGPQLTITKPIGVDHFDPVTVPIDVRSNGARIPSILVEYAGEEHIVFSRDSITIADTLHFFHSEREDTYVVPRGPEHEITFTLIDPFSQEPILVDGSSDSMLLKFPDLIVGSTCFDGIDNDGDGFTDMVSLQSVDIPEPVNGVLDEAHQRRYIIGNATIGQNTTTTSATRQTVLSVLDEQTGNVIAETIYTLGEHGSIVFPGVPLSGVWPASLRIHNLLFDPSGDYVYAIANANKIHPTWRDHRDRPVALPDTRLVKFNWDMTQVIDSLEIPYSDFPMSVMRSLYLQETENRIIISLAGNNVAPPRENENDPAVFDYRSGKIAVVDIANFSLVDEYRLDEQRLHPLILNIEGDEVYYSTLYPFENYGLGKRGYAEIGVYNIATGQHQNVQLPYNTIDVRKSKAIVDGEDLYFTGITNIRYNRSSFTPYPSIVRLHRPSFTITGRLFGANPLWMTENGSMVARALKRLGPSLDAYIAILNPDDMGNDDVLTITDETVDGYRIFNDGMGVMHPQAIGWTSSFDVDAHTILEEGLHVLSDLQCLSPLDSE